MHYRHLHTIRKVVKPVLAIEFHALEENEAYDVKGTSFDNQPPNRLEYMWRHQVWQLGVYSSGFLGDGAVYRPLHLHLETYAAHGIPEPRLAGSRQHRTLEVNTSS